jgi:hypothetical protein
VFIDCGQDLPVHGGTVAPGLQKVNLAPLLLQTIPQYVEVSTKY